MKRLSDTRGSVVVFFALTFVALVAVASVSVDVGSWWRSQRKLQSTADAATLAGAQDLPNTGTATTDATTYANSNNSGFTWDAGGPTYPNTYTIDVTLSKSVPSIFAKLVGISSKTVHAHAQAQIGTPTTVSNALPIGIKSTVACATGSTGCFGVSKTLTFDDTTTATFGSSTWGLLDLSGSATTSTACTGKVGESQQASWISNGYPGLLAINKYYGATTGQRTSIRTALNTRIGQVLLVPVFDLSAQAWCTAGGFHVIGWAAWVIDTAIPNSEWNPHLKILHGHFVDYIDHDVDSVPGTGGGFGVKVIKLSQ